MNGIRVHQLKTSRKYGEEEFAADLRNVLRRTGCNGEKICFILDESNILETSFLERMNTLLANGEVPGLFEGDDYSTLMTACKEGALRQGLNLDSSDELYKWFTSEIVRNLHVIFTMNPPDSDLSSQVATSPALFNRCVLNWMGDWSDHTLYEAAATLIKKIDIDKSEFKPPQTIKAATQNLTPPRSFREAVVNSMVFFHQSVNNLDKSLMARDSKLATTPGDYLDFVRHFVSIFNEKREELEDQQRHFNVGLGKIRGTVLKVRELREGLAVKQRQLEEKSEEAKDMLRQMVSGQNEAERKREASIQIQYALEIQETEIGKRQDVVLKDLARAEPAVLEAQKSVSNIKKQHLTELRSMANPPEPVKLTLESVCVLLGQKANTWRDVQLYIRRDDFIANIVNFDNGSQMTSHLRKRMEAEFLSLPNYNFEAVNRASKACGPLLQWVEAQVIYSSILERVGPLRDEVHQLEQEARNTKAQAQAISEMIAELEASIEKFKDQYAVLITETQTIKSEMTVVESKVNRSVQLVESLSSERERWSSSMKEFESKNESLAGNSLLSAAFITYAGYFDQQVRNYLLDLWRIYLEECGVEIEKVNTLSNYLSSGKQKLQWHENSLPVDDLCVENAIMIERYSRYPFIIDPTARIIEFLTKQHQARKLTVTSFLDDAFVKHLESALRFGNPILIQDAEYLDPVITQVLNKEYKKTGGRTLIELGRQDIDFSSDFKLYLLTRDPSVVVAPHISGRTTVINFTITRSSLESQAMNTVLQAERPDIEQKRRGLIKLQSEYHVHLRQLELSLLQALNASQGNILDSDKIIDTLENIKVEASEVGQKVNETEAVMMTIDHIMSDYQPLTRHSGMIFAILEKLSLVNSYYQFSLEFFLQIFKAVLAIPKQSDSSDRVKQLVRRLYVETYSRASHSLLKNDKVLLQVFLILTYVCGFDFDLLRRVVNPDLDTSQPDWIRAIFPDSTVSDKADQIGNLLAEEHPSDIWNDSVSGTF
jgi:dynein heavy chain 1